MSELRRKKGCFGQLSYSASDRLLTRVVTVHGREASGAHPGVQLSAVV